jgi:hypothetical protein
MNFRFLSFSLSLTEKREISGGRESETGKWECEKGRVVCKPGPTVFVRTRIFKIPNMSGFADELSLSLFPFFSDREGKNIEKCEMIQAKVASLDICCCRLDKTFRLAAHDSQMIDCNKTRQSMDYTAMNFPKSLSLFPRQRREKRTETQGFSPNPG